MKHVLIILICTIFGIVSCTPIDRCDYKVVIEYKIGDNAVTDTTIIKDTPVWFVPAYVLGKSGLQIIVTEGGHSYVHQIIYNGANPVTVEHFDYTVVSQISGEEIEKLEKEGN